MSLMLYSIPGNGHIGSGLPSAGAAQRNTRNASYVSYRGTGIFLN